jgi:hypothetical protein
MTPEAVFTTPNATVAKAAQEVVEKGMHRLLACKMTAEGRPRPICIVSTTDLVKEMRGAGWMWHID